MSWISTTDDVVDPIATTLSLFSGVAGLDLGWQLATGSRVVGYVERDAYAAAVLLARMEDETLEPAPVWCGDITELPVAPFHGVDAIIGGFPCQDISQAGNRSGIDGERSGLWGRAFVPAIRDLRPRYVFVENVSALLARGLDTVLGDLAALGYDADWTSLRASAVGAPHRRDRIFLLGHAQRLRWSERWPQSEGQFGRSDAAQSGRAMGHTAGSGLQGATTKGAQHSKPASGCGALAHAECPKRRSEHNARDEERWDALPQREESSGRSGISRGALADTECDGSRIEHGETSSNRSKTKSEKSETSRQTSNAGHCGRSLADTDSWRCEGEREPQRTGQQGERGRELVGCGHDWNEPWSFPPGPSGDWSDIPETLWPALERDFRDVADGLAPLVGQSRADALRCVGNGVVAIQAAVAARLLLRRI